MRSIHVVFVLFLMVLASQAIPVENRCRLPAHLRPLSCDSQNGKHSGVLKLSLRGLGIGIKLPQTKDTKPPHTTMDPPPKTERAPTSSSSKATSPKTSSVSPTKAATRTNSPSAYDGRKTNSPSPTKSIAQDSKTHTPSSTKADLPFDTLTSAKPTDMADVPRKSSKPALDGYCHCSSGGGTKHRCSSGRH